MRVVFPRRCSGNNLIAAHAEIGRTTPPRPRRGGKAANPRRMELQWESTGELHSETSGQGADLRSIYKEIGPGQRIALSKLAVDKFEETGRPLRIAIDVSIWLFQIQASKGTIVTPCHV